MRAARGALAGVMLVACAPVPPAPRPPAASVESPCRGARFDADRPDARCSVRGVEHPDPDRRTVALRLLETHPAVKSGGAATFTLAIENVGGTDLPITLYFSCGSFDGEAFNDAARTFESECGGMCGRGDPFSVTLAPGGVITKRVSIEAVMRRVEGDRCEQRNLGALPPGQYTLEVPLPWTDPSPIPGNPSARASRTFLTALTVVP